MARPALLLTQRLKLQGFIVSEHMALWPEALKELGGLVASGKLKYRESIAAGLESAPEAFLGLLKGRNFGKQLVKLAVNWTWHALPRARRRQPLRRAGAALPRLRAGAGSLPRPRRRRPPGLAPAGPRRSRHAAGLPAHRRPRREVCRALDRPRHHLARGARHRPGPPALRRRRGALPGAVAGAGHPHQRAGAPGSASTAAGASGASASEYLEDNIPHLEMLRSP